MSKETTTQCLRPGTRLQSKERVYEIVEVLGSGSFGITYKAISHVYVGNISTTMKFAIKEHFVSASCYRGEDGAMVLTVPQAKANVIDSRDDFITEANRLKRLCLKSRNIVSVNETFEANGTAYYVMEFLDGGSPLKCTEDEAISIVKQIANALSEIHEEKVLHLDIKPDNIVLKTNDHGETYPVLIDFGISKHFDSNNKPTSSLGAKGASPGYAPQEQYADVTEFSPKYDIYALGAVLYYLCTGKNPPDAFKISPNQQQLKAGLMGKVSKNVEKAVLNAMKPNAMERTPSIKQFCDDLMGVNFVPVLNISDSKMYFDKEKGQRHVTVDSNIGWSAYSDKDWCKVTKSGNNVVVSVIKNKETSDRSCNVIVTGSSYRISQIICVRQKGQGTVVLPEDPTWWDLHIKKIYQVAVVVVAGSLVAGLIVLLRPDPGKEAKRLTEAISLMDGSTLKEFAGNDSVRAYLPYARILFEDKDYENAKTYAMKACSSVDSIHAVVLLDSIQTVLMAQTQDTVRSDDNTEDVLIDFHEAEMDTQESHSEVIRETNDEKFARASNDFYLMKSLAEDNYIKAYYPLAVMYYNKSDKNNAKKWANKAVRAKINRSQAQQLLEKIEPKLPTNDELFASASTIADFKSLANKGYKKAYAPLAELYLRKYDYDNAHRWAVKAGNSKVNLDVVQRVVDVLASYGYYDNGEHGGKPEFNKE